MQNKQRSELHPPGSPFQTVFLRFWTVRHVISGDGTFGLPDSTMVRNLLTKNTTSFESDAFQTVCNRVVTGPSKMPEKGPGLHSHCKRLITEAGTSFLRHKNSLVWRRVKSSLRHGENLIDVPLGVFSRQSEKHIGTTASVLQGTENLNDIKYRKNKSETSKKEIDEYD